MRYHITLLCTASVVASVHSAGAQDRDQSRTRDRDRDRIRTRNVWISSDGDRPRLGVSTSSGSRRDTLGLLVTEVREGSPAAKAGIVEGDRIAAINGVNLRLSREDAGEDDMNGIVQRRLLRELENHKAGDELELRVYSNGQWKSVKAKLADPEDRERELTKMRDAWENRAALGISLGAGGSRRDTLGILVAGVTDDGPADKAGIDEGDRIAAVNGVDLRVAQDDAGEASTSSARVRRLSREMEKVKPGDEVELRVYSSGQTKSIRVKAGKASELSRNGMSYFFGEPPMAPRMPRRPDVDRWSPARPPRSPDAPDAPDGPPSPRFFRFDGGDGGDFRIDVDPEWRAELRDRLRDLGRGAMELRRLAPRVRVNIGGEIDHDGGAVDFDMPSPAVRPMVLLGGDGPRTAMASLFRGNRPGMSAVWSGDNESINIAGLRLSKVEGDLGSYLGAGSEHGLLVLGVSDDWSGVRVGDVILSIDGRSVRERGDDVRVQLHDGPSHDVRLIRGGREISLKAERP